MITPPVSAPYAGPRLGLARWALGLQGLGVVAVAVGLVFSRAAISLGFGAVAVGGLLALVAGVRVPRWAAWAGAALGALYVVQLVGLHGLEGRWFHPLKQTLPLLAVAVGLLAVPVAQRQRLAHLALGVLLAGVGVVALAAWWTYAFDQQAIDAAIRRSKPFPLLGGLDAIYYAPMAALAAGAAVWWARRLPRGLARWGLLALAALLVATLHLTASRTGLAVLYAVLGVELLAALRHRPRWLALGLVALLAVPLGAYTLLPSLQQRVANTAEDLGRYQRGTNLSDWSIGKRLANWQLGTQLVAKHPLHGVGLGQADLALCRAWAEQDRYIIIESYIEPDPHNQYLKTALELGLPGLLVLLGVLAWGAARATVAPGPLRLLVVAVATACLAESFLSRQLGLGLFALFWMLWAPLPAARKTGGAAAVPSA